ncbi:MAG TPA: hypothetical protein PLF63_14675, partial [Rubrivivax sp.]|nr:hypothetical protein [Rubrivivax sp.]
HHAPLRRPWRRPTEAPDFGRGLSRSFGEIAALRAEQARLAQELASLRALVQKMATELGMPADPPEPPVPQ